MAQLKNGIPVIQKKYTLDLLKEVGMLGCKLGDIFIKVNFKLKVSKGNLVDRERYQLLVGNLIYLSHTRVDIVLSVSIIS